MYYLPLQGGPEGMDRNGYNGSAVGGSSMIGYPLVIADSKRDMPGIEHGLLGWHTSALTTELHISFFLSSR